MSRFPLPLLLACLALASAAAAQEAPKPPPEKERPLFQQLFRRATGRNGYEELVMACDAYRASKFYAHEKPNLTLAERRLVLADRDVQRALALIRRGLGKPIASPREKLDLHTVLPELQPLRSLARLLALQQHVLLADGRVPEAIAQARLSLYFARAIQTDTIVSGLVGVAAGAVALEPLAGHLDQLSARDCDALYRVCIELLSQPDPLVPVMLAEHRFLRTILADLWQTARREGLPAAAKKTGLDQEEFRPVLHQLPSTPAGLEALYRDVDRRADEHFARVLAEMRKPPWQRQPAAFELAEDDLAGRALGLLMTAYARVADAYGRDTARLRLLACHSAIRLFRWEHDRLPGDLAEAGLAELAVDPFTGQPLRYLPAGRRFSLTSAGPVNPDDPRAVGGRVPVGLTADD